jgi:DivIVA domain-containing protein
MITPEDIHRIAFRKPPMGRRGYDEQEVDAFLDEVERTLTELNDEIARLRDTSPTDLTDIKAALTRIEAKLNGSPAAGGAFF